MMVDVIILLGVDTMGPTVKVLWYNYWIVRLTMILSFIFIQLRHNYVVREAVRGVSSSVYVAVRVLIDINFNYYQLSIMININCNIICK